VRIRLWYLFRKDLKEDQSTAECVFPEVFGMEDGRSESTEGRSKPGVGWRLTSGEFGDDRCMFIE